MDFPKNIFKAYDVRGLYPEELNEEIAYKIARAYGQMRQKELGRNDLTIATGRDMRLSSPLLHEAIKRGLTEQGIQAVGLGLCSTPTFIMPWRIMVITADCLFPPRITPKNIMA